MKVIECTKYGMPEVLQLKEVEKPSPKKNEVCIKIFATAVTASDCIVRGFKIPRWRPLGLLMGMLLGFRKPRNPILGLVLAGEIESVGESVRSFKKGDQVFAFTGTLCGTYAEYTCLPENSSNILAMVPCLMALKPSNVSYEEAAAIPYGGLLALSFLKKGNIQNGQNLLIYGASGAIGSLAVQIAKHFGAKVTGVCSTTNVESVKSLGADTVIEYTKDNFIKDVGLYDFIFDAVGKNKSSNYKLQCRKLLAQNGKYISVDDSHPKHHIQDLILLKELVEAGKIKAVIDRVYPLEQIVDAHKYVDKGHKKGNVVITLDYN